MNFRPSDPTRVRSDADLLNSAENNRSASGTVRNAASGCTLAIECNPSLGADVLSTAKCDAAGSETVPAAPKSLPELSWESPNNRSAPSSPASSAGGFYSAVAPRPARAKFLACLFHPKIGRTACRRQVDCRWFTQILEVEGRSLGAKVKTASTPPTTASAQATYCTAFSPTPRAMISQ